MPQKGQTAARGSFTLRIVSVLSQCFDFDSLQSSGSGSVPTTEAWQMKTWVFRIRSVFVKVLPNSLLQNLVCHMKFDFLNQVSYIRENPFCLYCMYLWFKNRCLWFEIESALYPPICLVSVLDLKLDFFNLKLDFFDLKLDFFNVKFNVCICSYPPVRLVRVLDLN